MQTIAGFYAQVMAAVLPDRPKPPVACGSALFWNSDDIEPNGRYRLPWIYWQLSKEESGLPHAKTWYVPRSTLNRAIADGELRAFEGQGGRYVRGSDLIMWLQGRFKR